MCAADDPPAKCCGTYKTHAQYMFIHARINDICSVEQLISRVTNEIAKDLRLNSEMIFVSTDYLAMSDATRNFDASLANVTKN